MEKAQQLRDVLHDVHSLHEVWMAACGTSVTAGAASGMPRLSLGNEGDLFPRAERCAAYFMGRYLCIGTIMLSGV